MTIYRCVGGINREIKDQYRGLGGVNRQIKEQYRCYGGVNRKVFSSVPSGALYWEGEEFTAKTGNWVAGFALLDGEQSKPATEMILTATATSTSTARRTYVTNNMINVSAYSLLKFEVEQSAASTAGYGAFGLKDINQKMSSAFTSVA
ncbi:MAG: hypothetical protein PHE79_09750, partial [Eubacteriales bacterium]|nr:hypothetical protein [Eubacteriales bacterium]